jgi:hypothetical protein
VQTLENATVGQERNGPFTEEEARKHKADTPKEKIVIDRIWNKRPDGFAIKMPTKTKTGELVIVTLGNPLQNTYGNRLMIHISKVTQ